MQYNFGTVNLGTVLTGDQPKGFIHAVDAAQFALAVHPRSTLCQGWSIPCTVSRLESLLYIMQGVSYALNNEELFPEECYVDDKGQIYVYGIREKYGMPNEKAEMLELAEATKMCAKPKDSFTYSQTNVIGSTMFGLGDRTTEGLKNFLAETGAVRRAKGTVDRLIDKKDIRRDFIDLYRKNVQRGVPEFANLHSVSAPSFDEVKKMMHQFTIDPDDEIVSMI